MAAYGNESGELSDDADGAAEDAMNESALADVYRLADGRLLTYDALQEEVNAEIQEQQITEEQGRGGYWDFHDYLIESCMVGIYESVHVSSTAVIRYSDGESTWTVEQLRDEVFPAQIAGIDKDHFPGGGLSFENWLAESCGTGIYKKIQWTLPLGH